MGAYNYKYVRDQLPPYLTDEADGYEGTCDYDGDMWAVASEYIHALEIELALQYAGTKTMQNQRLLAWLKARPKTTYNAGPAIVDT